MVDASVILALLAGVYLTLQGAAASEHAEHLGMGFASFWNRFSSAVAACIIVLIAVNAGAPIDFPAAARNTPWWGYLGGVFAAIYVVQMTHIVHRIGVATFATVTTLFWQLSSMLADNYGLLNLVRRTATPVRIAGCGLLLVGVVVVNGADVVVWRKHTVTREPPALNLNPEVAQASDSDSTLPEVDDKEIKAPAAKVDVEDDPPVDSTVSSSDATTPADAGDAPKRNLLDPSILIAAFGGVAACTQDVINSSTSTLGYGPWFTTFYSQLTASLLILPLFLFDQHRRRVNFRTAIKGAPWWSWITGLLSLAQIATAIIFIPRVGSAVFTGTSLAAQMISAIIMDHFGVMGLVRRPCGVVKMFGALLLLAGVALMTFVE